MRRRASPPRRPARPAKPFPALPKLPNQAHAGQSADQQSADQIDRSDGRLRPRVRGWRAPALHEKAGSWRRLPCLAQVGRGEILGVAQARPAQIGIGQIGAEEIRVIQKSAAQIGAARSARSSRAWLGPRPTDQRPRASPRPGREAQTRTAEIGFGKIGAAESGMVEHGAAQSAGDEIGAIETRQPKIGMGISAASKSAADAIAKRRSAPLKLALARFAPARSA